MTPEGLAARPEKLAAAEQAKAAREAAKLDSVAVGEQQPEVEHDLKGADTKTGVFEDRRWRDGQWFQYFLATRGEKTADLVVTYWGGDNGRTFDILLMANFWQPSSLRTRSRASFLSGGIRSRRDVLAAAANGRITVKFATKVWVAGGVYDVRLMRAGAGK